MKCILRCSNHSSRRHIEFSKRCFNMELGFNFDDDDFAEERQKKAVPLSYNAKICGPKWFLEDVSLEGDDKATVWKLRADYYFNTREYTKAADCFQQSLDSLGSQNRSMRREVVESMARCFIRTGNLAKALEYSDKMISDCLTSAHLCQALILQHQVHQSSGNTLEEIAVLYQLIQLHSFHFPFWSSLAKAYGKHEDRNSSVSNQLSNLKVSCQCPESDVKTDRKSGYTQESDCTKSPKGKTKQQDTKDSVPNETTLILDSHKGNGESVINSNLKCLKGDIKDESDGQVLYTDVEKKAQGVSSDDDGDRLFGYPRKFLVLTCLIRVKLILQSNCKNVGSFIKDKNLLRLKEIDQHIQAITTDEHILKTVTEFMRKDMFDDGLEETSSEENIDKKSADRGAAQSEEFVRKWFSWINLL